MTRIESVNGASGEGPSTGSARRESPIEIPDSVIMGDPVASALAVIAQFANQTRELNRELKRQADDHRVKAEQQEIAALREKADAIRTGAWFAAGALAASAALHGLAFAFSCSAEPPCDGVKESALEKLQRALDGHRAKLCSATADLLARGSDVATRFSSASELGHETEAKAAASSAKSAESDAQQHREAMHAAAEIAERAYEAIRRVSELQHGAELAIWQMHA